MLDVLPMANMIYMVYHSYVEQRNVLSYGGPIWIFGYAIDNLVKGYPDT